MAEQAEKTPQNRRSRVRKAKAPNTYSTATADRICEILETSFRSLESIARSEDGMPNIRTLYRWLEQYDDFRRNYTLARQVQGDNLLFECLEIADNDAGDLIERTTADGQPCRIPNPAHLARDKLRISQRMKLLTWLQPKTCASRPMHNA